MLASCTKTAGERSTPAMRYICLFGYFPSKSLITGVMMKFVCGERSLPGWRQDAVITHAANAASCYTKLSEIRLPEFYSNSCPGENWVVIRTKMKSGMQLAIRPLIHIFRLHRPPRRSDMLPLFGGSHWNFHDLKRPLRIFGKRLDVLSRIVSHWNGTVSAGRWWRHADEGARPPAGKPGPHIWSVMITNVGGASTRLPFRSLT